MALAVGAAATVLVLRSRGLSELGYKGSKVRNLAKRAELLRAVPDTIEVGEYEDVLMASDDAFDAVLCLLAAKDFCSKIVRTPEDLDRAKREGWIWFREARQLA